jgi:8-oxo-dGTP pyrophosphatase MutT (NUDIX family)
MLVRDAPELEVLMLRRTARTIFAGDMWVYPGGAVDGADATHLVDRCDGMSDADASARLGINAGGLGYWVAAVRECFEEAGVLFSSAGLDPGHERMIEHRIRLNARQTEFAAIVHDEQLRLDLSGIHYVAHWRTPLGPPRRFDTRFFLAAMPEGQTPSHDDGEAVHHEWVRPIDAVDRWRNDQMAMMSPTARMMMCLASFESATDLIAAASRQPPTFAQVRVRRHADDRYDILLPHESGWESGDPSVEFGFVGLFTPAQRAVL